MKTICITEEQKNNLCKELSKLLFEFRKNSGVECIYFAPYQDSDDSFIRFTVVCTNDSKYELYEQILKYNIEYQDLDSFKKIGFKLHLGVDINTEYANSYLNYSQFKRFKKLFNSTILYDKDGTYSKIKNIALDEYNSPNSDICYFDNLASINPDIYDELKVLKRHKNKVIYRINYVEN